MVYAPGPLMDPPPGVVLSLMQNAPGAVSWVQDVMLALAWLLIAAAAATFTAAVFTWLGLEVARRLPQRRRATFVPLDGKDM